MKNRKNLFGAEKPVDVKEDIVVLGAGLSGLGFNHSLPCERIFEANAHPGGHAYSHAFEGCFFDQGAHIAHSKTTQFLEMIYRSAGDVHQIEPSIVANYSHGQWLTYPVQNHLHELPIDKRVQALTDLIMAHIKRNPEEAESYSDWCLSQYGEYLTRYFYKEFTQKYWRLPMNELATDWLGGRLIPAAIPNIIRGAFSAQTEKEASFTKFNYPLRGGFFGFFKSLYDDMMVHYSERANEIDVKNKEIAFESGRKERYGLLASSIPLPQLVAMIKDAPTSVKEAGELLRHTKLLCVNLIVARPNLMPYHWCYVYDEDIQPARISFPSNLSSTPIGNAVSTLQAEIFRRDDEDWDIEALTETSVKQMANLFGFDPKKELLLAAPLVTPYAYVISDLNRKTSVEYILSWLRQNDIFCMGLYGKWKYIWSDIAYYSGVETANEIKEQIC